MAIIYPGFSNAVSFGTNIKSIQRGYAAESDGSITVTISSVNPSKCIISVNSGGYGQSTTASSGWSGHGPYISSFTSTQIQFAQGYWYTASSFVAMSFTWQIVEYE